MNTNLPHKIFNLLKNILVDFYAFNKRIFNDINGFLKHRFFINKV